MSARDLVIVGAGGFARETVELVRAADPAGERWRPIGVVDDDPARSGATVAGLPVLGPVDSVRDGSAAVVVCVGNPSNFVARAMIVDRLALDDDRYATLVHPSAVVPSTATLGAGTVLHAAVVLTTDVEVGRHVAVMPGVVLTHDDEVGDFATFGAGVRVGGGCRIGTGAYLGAGSVLRESTTIGPWSLVGAGSVVLSDVPPGEVWVGNPARRLRPVEPIGDLAGRLGQVPPAS